MAFKGASRFQQRPNRKDMYGRGGTGSTGGSGGNAEWKPPTHFEVLGVEVPYDFNKDWGKEVEEELKAQDYYSENGFGLEYVMVFGQYQRLSIKDIIKKDVDYISWLCNKFDWFRLSMRALKYYYMEII